MAIFFCSFADKRFHKSLKRIKKQAHELGAFDGGIFCWNEFDLDTSFRKNFASFLQPFTFYLCAWKPQVILQAFTRMKEGDILLYADVGCHINRHGIKRFREYIEQLKKSDNFLLVSQFYPDMDMPEASWTKGDTFDYFDCRYDSAITKSPQVIATTFFIKKNQAAETFIHKWLKVFSDDPLLADRGICKSPNLEGYIEHRSDQSFFSILAKKNRIETFSPNELQGSAAWETDMIEYPIWAKRDRVMDDGFWIHPTPGRLLLLVKRKLEWWLNRN